MSGRARALSAGLLAVLVPAAAAHRLQTLEAIPAAFHGEWAADPAWCGSGDNDDRLIIGPQRWQTYESMGTVRTVVAAGPRRLVLVIDSEGEGERWQDTVLVHLDRRGRLHLPEAAVAPVRQRCGH